MASCLSYVVVCFFFFKQKTAYEMRISDWSSGVCSSDLETVLGAVRPHTAGRLWCVFGCGGDRDPGKRPMMGAVVGRLADRAIVTDDNPRSADPAAIRAAALAACPAGEEIGDRALAIREGVLRLGPGVGLMVAGKGTQQGQAHKGALRPFDDAPLPRAAGTAHPRR